MFCAGDGKGGSDSCKGDSGGAFVRKRKIGDKYRWVAAGIFRKTATLSKVLQVREGPSSGRAEAQLGEQGKTFYMLTVNDINNRTSNPLFLRKTYLQVTYTLYVRTPIRIAAQAAQVSRILLRFRRACNGII
ncbi:Serine protease hepsin [Acropora cervicornis]|uniref:Serine protease hepsin n=1 Tax=Acropora cervicornis TaxID=6130 RepID=A0AAD9PPZ0_ACRCE|nr:Serine protease hepsin [Acropora cervicornis]